MAEPHIPELTEDQLNALRFASDAELPDLAAKALEAKPTRTQIKQPIRLWRADYWRVLSKQRLGASRIIIR